MEKGKPKSAMRYETTIKELFQTLPQILLKLLVGQEATELLTVEFPSIKKRLPDLVVRLISKNIFHLELQSDSNEVMDWRMLEYYALIRQRYKNYKIIQRVLYVGSGKPHFPTKIDEGGIHFEYTVIDIRDIDCHLMLASPCLEENLLAILCRLEDERETIREILSRIANLPSKARADALEKLVILAGLRKLETTIKEEVKKMGISVDVMENAYLRELFMEGERKGRQEGLQKGEGAMLLRLLQQRFDEVPTWARDKISKANLPALEAWGFRFVNAKSLKEVFT